MNEPCTASEPRAGDRSCDEQLRPDARNRSRDLYRIGCGETADRPTDDGPGAQIHCSDVETDPGSEKINCPSVLVRLLPLSVPAMIRAPPLLSEMGPVPEIEAPASMSTAVTGPSIASSVNCAPEIV